MEQKENMRAALLLEQAALCPLRVLRLLHRRRWCAHAVHMVHAGPRYKCRDQKALGMRAYRCALHEKDVSTSERCGWKYIDYI
jgi:hypothetical protein